MEATSAVVAKLVSLWPWSISATGRARVAFGVLLVVAAVFLLDPLFAPRVPLYVPGACVPDNCHYPNTPRFPVFALVAGMGHAWLIGAHGSRAIALGSAIGLAATLAAGLFAAAVVPFHDPYFVSVYRAYALAYLATALAALAFISVRSFRGWSAVGWPVVAAGSLALASTAARGDLAIAAVAVAAIGFGIAASVAVRRPLTLRMSPELGALLVVSIAFVIRAGFGLLTLARTGPGMDFAIASDDGDTYFRLASLIADKGAWLEVLAAGHFSPGYSMFVGTILAVTGGRLAAVVLIQAALAALGTFLVWRLGSMLAGPAAGALAALLVAAEQNLIQNSSTLTAEALLVPMILLVLYSFARYARAGGPSWLLVGVLPLSVCLITRNVVGYALLLPAIGWLGWRRRRMPGLLIRDVGAAVAAGIIAVLPVATATYIREGTPRIDNQNASLQWGFDGGPQMTISNNFLLDRGIRPFEDPLGSARAALSDPIPVMSFLIGSAPQRISTLLFFLTPGAMSPLFIVNPVIYPNAYGDALGLLRQAALLVGLGVLIRLRAWRTAPELGLIAAYAVSYLAVFVFVFAPYHPFRYRIPVEPIRFIFEAVGLLLMLRVVWAAATRWSAERSGSA